MTYCYVILFFLTGLVIGSFLNVVSLRFKPGEKVFGLKNIGGRSACPYCRKTLNWRELIPIVSFFIQAGKCRSCGHRLSWQYPLTEFLSGLLFAAVSFSFHNLCPILHAPCVWFWAFWLLALLILLLISLIDFRHFFIPDELTWLLLFLGLAIILLKFQVSSFKFQVFPHSFILQYALVFSFSWLGNVWINHLFAALTASIFFGLLFFLGKGNILGGGDVKLGFALGFLLGWPDTLIALIIAFILGGITGSVLMIIRKKTMKDFLPLAPFLAIGVALTVFFGYQIINGYFSLMGL